MYYRILAELVVVVHFAFVVFVVLGGFLILWRRKVIWLHAPAVLWAAWIELSGGICPLTPLENWFWIQGGQASYPDDFVGNYILPLIYPEGLTRTKQLILAAMAIFVNILVYGYIFLIRRKGRLINTED
jgi:hypothetical protein